MIGLIPVKKASENNRYIKLVRIGIKNDTFQIVLIRTLDTP